MSPKQIDDQYSDEEARRRFEAALHGAREVGHEPMKDISPKRATPDSAMKIGKRKASPKKRGPTRGKPSPSDEDIAMLGPK
jgi:hypothetical protein